MDFLLRNLPIFDQIHFLLNLSTKYATVKSPAIARRALNTGIGRRVGLDEGFFVGVGVGLTEDFSAGVGVGLTEDFCVGVGTAEGFEVDEGFGLGEGVGTGEIVGVIMGVGVGVMAGDLCVEVGAGSVRTIWTVLSMPPAVIRNLPSGTPSVSMSSLKSPFESAMHLIEMAIFRFTEVAPSVASPDILMSFLPGGISIFIPNFSIGKENESVTIPFVIFSGASITGIPGHIVALTVSPLHVAVNGDTDICILFMFSARAEIFLSPAIKLIPRNSSIYLPVSETGNEISNDESNHTASFGAAFPYIENVSPCKTKEGTFSSVTLAPAIGTDTVNAQSNNKLIHDTALICFICISTTPN